MSNQNSNNQSQSQENKTSQHHNRSRTQAAKDALSRSSYGMVDSMTLGVHDVMWAVRHPLKFASRSFGFFMGGLGVCTLVVGTTYLFFGEPGSADFEWTDPADIVRSGIDQVRPVWSGVGKGIGDAVNNPTGAEGEYDGADYRR